jgi:soluble lytic murein transglycosylase-like protein
MRALMVGNAVIVAFAISWSAALNASAQTGNNRQSPQMPYQPMIIPPRPAIAPPGQQQQYQPGMSYGTPFPGYYRAFPNQQGGSPAQTQNAPGSVSVTAPIPGGTNVALPATSRFHWSAGRLLPADRTQQSGTDRAQQIELMDIAQRDNNPLEIGLSKMTQHWVDEKLARVDDTTGGRKILHFQNPQSGFEAARELLTSMYSNCTVDQAARELSAGCYNGAIVPALRGKKVSTLTDAQLRQLIGAMARKAGYFDNPSWFTDRRSTSPSDLDVPLLTSIPLKGMSRTTETQYWDTKANRNLLKATSGVAASQQAANYDMANVLRYKDLFEKTAKAYDVPPALLAAIASRETHGGTILTKEGWGMFDRNGYGLMQIDGTKHTPDMTDGPRGRANVEQAARILRDDFVIIQKDFPKLTPTQQWLTAASWYNGGDARPYPNSDRGTTGGDYGNDVMARAQFYARCVTW